MELKKIEIMGLGEKDTAAVVGGNLAKIFS